MTIERSAAAQWLRDGTRAVGRSFRLHRPRGAFCHGGWCQQCKVVDLSGEVKLACQQSPTTTCKPSGDFDILRVVGRLAERLPPWFWERIAYRPSPLRQPFLKLIRRLSAAPRLPERPAPGQPNDRRTESCEILVVGGGISGLVAAVTMAEQGRRVSLVTVDQLGGSALTRPGAGVEAALLVQKATQLVQCYEGTLCLGLYDNGSHAWCVGNSQVLRIEFGTLVVATGAYDRLPTVPGNDVPGVIGLRAFERLAASDSIPSHFRVGAVGHEVEISRATESALAARIELAFVATSAAVGPARVREHTGVTIKRIDGGANGVTGVEFSDGTYERCELLVICESQPTYELQAQAGASMGLRGAFAIPCAAQDTCKALIVGEAAGWFDPAGSAERTREAILRWIAEGTKPGSAAWTSIQPEASPAAAPDAFVCLCEDVRVRDVEKAIEEGYTDIELIKRHTGAGTGPCQGKLCHGAMLACAMRFGLEVRIPTPRPLLRPTRMNKLVAPPSRTR